MIASAKDLVEAGFESELVKVGKLEVEVVGMTVAQAYKFSEFCKKQDDKMLVFAYLIKLCCPAFRMVWWTPRRIGNKLSPKVLVELASKIMEVSGYSEGAVETSLKD